MSAANKRLLDYQKILPVIELYPCVQGEGSLRGIPTVAVRTTGCTHRCHFGAGGWCDTWYSSIHADKGIFSFQQIIACYDAHPHIKHMMLTGGSPTMHPALINELTHFANSRGIFITLETEGSHFLATDFPLDLLSLSPKLSNSIPALGLYTPKGHLVDEQFVKTHERYRLNIKVISQLIAAHKDYQFKPVWDGSKEILEEIEAFRLALDIPLSKTWLMPAGESRAQQLLLAPLVIDTCIKYGYNYGARDHILIYDSKRLV